MYYTQSHGVCIMMGLFHQATHVELLYECFDLDLGETFLISYLQAFPGCRGFTLDVSLIDDIKLAYKHGFN